MYEFRTSLPQRIRRLTRLSGMSLVEFMVAITIGTILALGIMILMSRTSRSYKINDEFSRMQEAGTTALNYLETDIHMAGFYGLAGTADTISAYPDTSNPPKLSYGEPAVVWGTTAGPGTAMADCGQALWSFQPSVPVNGLPPGTTAAQANTALPCIPTSNYVTGPAVVLRGAAGTMINRNANGQPQNWTSAQLNANTIYVQSDPGNGFIFQGVNYDAYKAAGYTRVSPAGVGVFVDAPIYPYQSNIYYVRPCSRPTGGPDGWGNPTCQGAGIDDQPNPDPIPTLVRQQWQSTPGGPAYNEVGLVEGVEQFNVLYGLDTLSATGAVIPVGCNTAGACATPPDGVADSYTTTPPNANAWSQVVMVRVNVLVRSTSPTNGYDDSPKSYDLGGGNIWNCAAVGAPCNYHRHMFSQQIEVKNIAGRRSG